MNNSNNMYPTVPSAPHEDEGMEPTKVYPPLQPVTEASYPMPPPAYSEQAPILQAQAPQPAQQTTIGKTSILD